MSIQNITGRQTMEGKLSLTWKNLTTPIAISIHVAQDSEFIQHSRLFVIPNHVDSCTLDIGKGSWFYRIGAWIGTQAEGAIEWSGIYGPILLQTNKQLLPLKQFPYIIHAIKPALNSINIHTGAYEPCYMVIHSTDHHVLQASRTKSIYMFDWGGSIINVPNLDASKEYTFQIQTIAGNPAKLPTSTIEVCTEPYHIEKKRSGMPVQGRSGTDRATYAADKANLQHAIGKQSQKFDSYAQYIQFQAAKARTSASQQ